MGVCYENGIGYGINLKKAAWYYFNAFEKGDKVAEKLLLKVLTKDEELRKEYNIFARARNEINNLLNSFGLFSDMQRGVENYYIKENPFDNMAKSNDSKKSFRF